MFGCLWYSHLPQVKRDKLDKRAEPGIFIGYSTVSKAYKIFQPQSGKFLVSRDVHFMEDEKWCWSGPNKNHNVVLDLEETVDDPPIRGTRLVSNIYQRSNVAVCNIAVFEPASFEEAVMEAKWLAAMKEELSMIEKNQTWELVPRPHNRKVIGVKWVFRTKFNSDGSINKHKARLVVKGYSQIFGIDYSDTFAPVARHDTIRLLLAVVAQKGWRVFHMDVKSAFLNGFLQEEIYVEQPDGFVIKGQEKKFYLLKKALYGLKQAPRVWYNRINDHLLHLGFQKSLSEATLYVKHVGADILIISLYVDDLLVTGSNLALVEEFKQEMKDVFEMTDLGLMTYFLGMEITQKKNEIFICQKK